jgi:hypothetical protein
MKRFITLLLSTLLSASAFAGTINWTLTMPTQYEDNTPLLVTDITQSRIEYATCLGVAPNQTFGTKLGEVVTPSNATAVSKSGLTAGDYCTRGYVTAKGIESLVSNLVVKTLSQAGPKPPVLAATVSLAMTVKHTDHGWDMVQNVGDTIIGAECDAAQSFGQGFYALKNPKTDVHYYSGQRPRKTIAAQCG